MKLVYNFLLHHDNSTIISYQLKCKEMILEVGVPEVVVLLKLSHGLMPLEQPDFKSLIFILNSETFVGYPTFSRRRESLLKLKLIKNGLASPTTSVRSCPNAQILKIYSYMIVLLTKAILFEAFHIMIKMMVTWVYFPICVKHMFTLEFLILATAKEFLNSFERFLILRFYTSATRVKVGS